jgi:hypothetical protein
VMSENPESGGRARGHWRDGLERFGRPGYWASIPALLALETLACKPRWPGPARTGEDWAARQ